MTGQLSPYPNLKSKTITIVAKSFNGIDFNNYGTIVNESVLSNDSGASLVNLGLFSNKPVGVLTNMYGGLFKNIGNIDANGILNNYGIFSNNGTLNVPGSLGSGTLVNTGEFHNTGTVTIYWTLNNNGMFTNNGLLDNRGPGILTNKGSLVNNHKLSNDGVFSNSIGSIVNNSSFINYQKFDNTGSFQNNINGTVTTLGTLANEDELINLGTVRIQQLGSIDNTGKFGNQ